MTLGKDVKHPLHQSLAHRNGLDQVYRIDPLLDIHETSGLENFRSRDFSRSTLPLALTLTYMSTYVPYYDEVGKKCV
jgi:hypothetical protein